MSNQFSELFKGLQDPKLVPKPNIKHQVYEIKSGIFVIDVCIPLNRTIEFENIFESLEDVNSYTVNKLIKTFGGYIKESI